ncbi:MAG: glycosyltransferase family 2 protein [Bacteroidales bacterium]
MLKTAVVILNWNGLSYLKTFLPSVLQHSNLPGTKVCIADNGSTDESVKWLRDNHPGIEIVTLEENHGFAGGYNRALEQITAEYYVLLNSDVEVTSSWLEPLVNFLDNNPEYAACQPRIMSERKRDFFEYAGAAGGYIDKFGFPFCRGRIFYNVEKDYGQYNSEADVFWTSGACMIIRSEVWKKCGGLDNDFFAHMEEIDLCWRVLNAGYKLRYLPQSTVFHVGGGALPYESKFKIYLNFRNNLFMLYKNLAPGDLVKTLFIRKIFDGMAAVRFLLSGKPALMGSVWRAHMDYYKNLKQLRIKRNEAQKIICEKRLLPVLNKSIVIEFYLKGSKTFDRLKTNF